MFEHALPLWARSTWDGQNCGAVEALDFSGRDAGLNYRRTRVLARQIYVFSHAHVLGWPNGKDLAGQCVNHLTGTIWTGPDTGLPRRMSRAGEITDPVIDLYDHAFALFALAWHARATNDQTARDWVHRMLDFIEEQLRHPTQPGFLHQVPVEGWRLQNPHMHLTEACIASFEATGDNRFRDVARELVALMRNHFLDSESGALRESFTDDLQPIEGPDGEIVEPGHQLEWSWILNAMRPYSDDDLSEDIRDLNRFAERHGFNPANNTVRNAVDIKGRVIDGGWRIWPNTERLKSAVALHDLDGADPSDVFAQTLGLLFGRHLDCQPRGLWNDAYNARGEPTAVNVPTSTFYHIMLAFAEVLRVDPDA